MIDKPSDETLNDSLNMWPKGTKGHEAEKELIGHLNILC